MGWFKKISIKKLKNMILSEETLFLREMDLSSVLVGGRMDKCVFIIGTIEHLTFY